MGYRLAVDLGTTFTAAATISEATPVMVGLGNRAMQVPSVLFLAENGDCVVGEAAERRGATDPGRLVREFKRRLGDHVPLLVGGAAYSAETLTARMLRWVIDTTTTRMGSAPETIVCTRPANWGPYKRELFAQAVALAGVSDARHCTEPEAAAAQYAARAVMAEGERIAVYDLGGGTFDVCVVERTAAGFALLGTPDGVEHLGGIDFDAALTGFVMQMLAGRLPDLDPEDEDTLVGLARLRRDCVEAKEALSSEMDAAVPVALPGLSTMVRLNRGDLEAAIRPALTDTVAATRRTLRSAHLEGEQLKAIVLVGGSSRIPLVGELLQREFEVPVALDTHPKHDIALGAARLAPSLSGAGTGTVGGRASASVSTPPAEPTEQPRDTTTVSPGGQTTVSTGGQGRVDGASPAPTPVIPHLRGPAPGPAHAALPGGSRRSRALVRIAAVLAVAAVVTVIIFGVRFLVLRGTKVPPKVPVTTTVERAVPATQLWTDMDLSCVTGDTLEIVVSGTAMHEDSATGEVTPNGLSDPKYHRYNVPGLPDANTVAVIGSLDQAPPLFVVGTGTTYICPRDGALFLGINDIGVGNNSGAFSAKITKTHTD